MKGLQWAIARWGRDAFTVEVVDSVVGRSQDEALRWSNPKERDLIESLGPLFHTFCPTPGTKQSFNLLPGGTEVKRSKPSRAQDQAKLMAVAQGRWQGVLNLRSNRPFEPANPVACISCRGHGEHW